MRPSFSVLLLSAVAWAQYVSPPDLRADCKGRKDGVYAKEACSEYFNQCRNEDTITVKCSTGLWFNPQTLNCDDKEHVEECKGEKFTCVEKEDGKYGSGCSSMFWYCNNGALEHMHCPKGLFYDLNTQDCNYKSLIAVCGGDPNGTISDDDVRFLQAMTTTLPPTSTEEFMRTYPTYSSLLRINAVVPKTPLPESDAGTLCAGRMDGAHKIGPCSSGYVVCWSGSGQVNHCRGQLIFNEEIDQCDAPENVPGCQSVQFHTSPYGMPSISAAQTPDQLLPLPRDVPSFSCDGRPDSLYSSSACAVFFFQCVSGMAHIHSCPPGTLFDHSTSRCEMADVCGRVPPPQPSSIPPTQQPAAPSVPAFDCSTRQNGYYAPRCSPIFFQCVHGQSHPQTCQEGLMFNEELAQCDFLPECAKTAQTPANAPADSGRDFDCSSRANGIYGIGCEGRFYRCSSGVSHVQQCPEALVFNEAAGYCDYPDNCGKVPTQAPPTQDLPPTANVDFDCSSMPDGVYSPSCSSVFYQCSHGILHAQSCPTPLVFNKDAGFCDYDDKCGLANAPADTTTPPASYIPSTAAPQQNSPSFECASRPDGVYGQGCSPSFFKCSAGIASEMKCPDGLVYNEAIDGCDYAENCGRTSAVVISEGEESLDQQKMLYTVADEKSPVSEVSNGEQDTVMAPFDCSLRPEGLYSLGECSVEYVHCSNGLTHHKECPSGLVFFEREGMCDYATMCGRNGQSEQNTQTPDISTETPAADATVQQPAYESRQEDSREDSKSRSTSSFVELKDIDCGSLSDGMYAPTCSSHYIHCSNGHSYPMSCPANLYFDTASAACDYNDACPSGVQEAPTMAPAPTASSAVFNSLEDIDCGMLSDGIYTVGCSQSFVQCLHHEKFVRQCAFDEFYNKDMNACDRNTNCRFRQVDKIEQVNNDEAKRPSGVQAVKTLDIDCTTREDGVYSVGCAVQFVQCVNGVAFPQMCPKDLLFNEQLQACDFPESCSGKKTTAIGEDSVSSGQQYQKTIYQSDTSGQVIMHNDVYSPANVEDTSCTGTEKTPIAKCSSKFLQCMGGRLIARRCPGQSLFDRTLSLCVYDLEGCVMDSVQVEYDDDYEQKQTYASSESGKEYASSEQTAYTTAPIYQTTEGYSQPPPSYYQTTVGYEQTTAGYAQTETYEDTTQTYPQQGYQVETSSGYQQDSGAYQQTNYEQKPTYSQSTSSSYGQPAGYQSQTYQPGFTYQKPPVFQPPAYQGQQKFIFVPRAFVEGYRHHRDRHHHRRLHHRRYHHVPYLPLPPTLTQSQYVLPAPPSTGVQQANIAWYGNQAPAPQYGQASYSTNTSSYDATIQSAKSSMYQPNYQNEYLGGVQEGYGVDATSGTYGQEEYGASYQGQSQGGYAAASSGGSYASAPKKAVKKCVVGSRIPSDTCSAAFYQCSTAGSYARLFCDGTKRFDSKHKECREIFDVAECQSASEDLPVVVNLAPPPLPAPVASFAGFKREEKTLADTWDTRHAPHHKTLGNPFVRHHRRHEFFPHDGRWAFGPHHHRHHHRHHPGFGVIGSGLARGYRFGEDKVLSDAFRGHPRERRPVYGNPFGPASHHLREVDAFRGKPHPRDTVIGNPFKRHNHHGRHHRRHHGRHHGGRRHHHREYFDEDEYSRAREADDGNDDEESFHEKEEKDNEELNEDDEAVKMETTTEAFLEAGEVDTSNPMSEDEVEKFEEHNKEVFDDKTRKRRNVQLTEMHYSPSRARLVPSHRLHRSRFARFCTAEAVGMSISIGQCRQDFIYCKAQKRPVVAACPVDDLFDAMQSLCVPTDVCGVDVSSAASAYYSPRPGGYVVSQGQKQVYHETVKYTDSSSDKYVEAQEGVTKGYTIKEESSYGDMEHRQKYLETTTGYQEKTEYQDKGTQGGQRGQYQPAQDVSTVTATQASDSSCDNLPDGPQQLGCSNSYIVCVAGNTYKENCPVGLYFDGDNCAWKHDVKECGGSGRIPAASTEGRLPELPASAVLPAPYSPYSAATVTPPSAYQPDSYQPSIEPVTYVPQRTYENQEAIFTQPPVMPYQPPAAIYKTSAAPYQPPAATYQPSATYQPPAATYQPPAATYQPPAATYQPPAATYQPPAATYQPPAATYQPPAAIYETSQPPAATYQPPAATYQPPAATYQPPAATYQPPAATYQPPAAIYETSQPPAATYQPPSMPYQPPAATYQPSAAPYEPSAVTYQPAATPPTSSYETPTYAPPTYEPSVTYQPPATYEPPTPPTYNPPADETDAPYIPQQPIVETTQYTTYSTQPSIELTTAAYVLPPTFVCSQPNEGFSIDCEGRYVSCSNGVAHLMQCPATLVYDESTASCRYPAFVPACGGVPEVALPAAPPSPPAATYAPYSAAETEQPRPAPYIPDQTESPEVVVPSTPTEVPRPYIPPQEPVPAQTAGPYVPTPSVQAPYVPPQAQTEPPQAPYVPPQAQTVPSTEPRLIEVDVSTTSPSGVTRQAPYQPPAVTPESQTWTVASPYGSPSQTVPPQDPLPIELVTVAPSIEKPYPVEQTLPRLPKVHCPPSFSGLHSEGCSPFYAVCVSGVSQVVMSCAPGTLFDLRRQECAYRAHIVECGGTPVRPGVPSVVDQSVTPSTIQPQTMTSAIPVPEDIPHPSSPSWSTTELPVPSSFPLPESTEPTQTPIPSAFLVTEHDSYGRLPTANDDQEIVPVVAAVPSPSVADARCVWSGAMGGRCSPIFTVCTDGKPESFECHAPLVFDEKTQSCGYKQFTKGCEQYEMVDEVVAVEEIQVIRTEIIEGGQTTDEQQPLLVHSTPVPTVLEPETEETPTSTTEETSTAFEEQDSPYGRQSTTESSTQEEIHIVKHLPMPQFEVSTDHCVYDANHPAYPLNHCSITYAICIPRGTSLRVNCTGGYLFDSVVRHCIPAEHCGQSYVKDIVQAANNGSIPIPDSIEYKGDDRCVGVPNGTLKPVGVCSDRYIKCGKNQVRLMSCRSSAEAFAVRLGKCVLKAQLGECSRRISPMEEREKKKISSGSTEKRPKLVKKKTVPRPLSNDEARAFCSGRADGIYRSPNDCAGIVQCFGEELFSYPSCQAGLSFNEDSMQCDYSAAVGECEAEDPTVVVDESFDNVCASRPHGAYLPDDADCSVFYRCVWSRVEKLSCPEGTAFNPLLSVCDWPENSQCKARKAPATQ